MWIWTRDTTRARLINRTIRKFIVNVHPSGGRNFKRTTRIKLKRFSLSLSPYYSIAFHTFLSKYVLSKTVESTYTRNSTRETTTRNNSKIRSVTRLRRRRRRTLRRKLIKSKVHAAPRFSRGRESPRELNVLSSPELRDRSLWLAGINHPRYEKEQWKRRGEGRGGEAPVTLLITAEREEQCSRREISYCFASVLARRSFLARALRYNRLMPRNNGVTWLIIRSGGWT